MSGQKSSLRRLVLATLMIASIVLVAWFCLGSFFGFAVGISAGALFITVITFLVIATVLVLIPLLAGLSFFLVGLFLCIWILVAIILFPLIFPIIVPVFILALLVYWLKK